MAPTVLVVDDDADNVDVFTRLFEAEGLSVISARDGLRGVEFLSKGLLPDAIVTDELMPLVLGSELVKFVRTQHKLRHTPIVVLSAVESPVVPDAYTQVWRKPCEPQALVALVAAAARINYERRLISEAA